MVALTYLGTRDYGPIYPKELPVRMNRVDTELKNKQKEKGKLDREKDKDKSDNLDRDIRAQKDEQTKLNAIQNAFETLRTSQAKLHYCVSMTIDSHNIDLITTEPSEARPEEPPKTPK